MACACCRPLNTPRNDLSAHEINGTSGSVKSRNNEGDTAMLDKDRIAGAAKQVKGSIKEAAGKTVGDAKLVAEGHADKTEGKIQNAIGSLKDTIKDAVKGD